MRLTDPDADPGVYLDERPARGRVHEPHNGGQAALQPHRVLGHFALRVPETYINLLNRKYRQGDWCVSDPDSLIPDQAF